MLLSVLLSLSCSPRKQLTRTQEQRQSEWQQQLLAEQYRIRDSLYWSELDEILQRQIALYRTRDRTIAEDVETLTREYDTSRPVDSLTGKPPLLRETTRRRHRTDSLRDSARARQTETREAQVQTAGELQQREQSHLQGEADRTTQAEAATETESRRGLAWWQKALCLVGVLTLIYILYRIFKNH